MRIVFYGDSITDAERLKEFEGNLLAPYAFGPGYVNAVSSELIYSNPNKYEIINTGISGNRIVDLYARIKKDCWNYNPDVISVLIGINDVWHEIFDQNGVSIDRFEKVYRMMITDTLNVLPNVKFILMEPFVQMGSATNERYQDFLAIKEYSEVVRKIALEFNCAFVELQKPLDEYAKKFGTDKTLLDGVHPAMAGARVIANEWLKVFQKELNND